MWCNYLLKLKWIMSTCLHLRDSPPILNFALFLALSIQILTLSFCSALLQWLGHGGKKEKKPCSTFGWTFQVGSAGQSVGTFFPLIIFFFLAILQINDTKSTKFSKKSDIFSRKNVGKYSQLFWNIFSQFFWGLLVLLTVTLRWFFIGNFCYCFAKIRLLLLLFFSRDQNYSMIQVNNACNVLSTQYKR